MLLYYNYKKTNMLINFDIISDLYIEDYDDFSWENKATSLCCIVAGNIASDRHLLFRVLENLGTYYEKVFFIDGALEHTTYNSDFIASYDSLSEGIGLLDNVFFLHENIIIMNGATLVSTNGWTTFDFTKHTDLEETIEFLDLRGVMPTSTAYAIRKMSHFDVEYLSNSISACQTMLDAQNIIVVTNAVPDNSLIDHDFDYHDTILGDTSGNNALLNCIEEDTEGKISTWVFATYDGEIDIQMEGIRFVNNPGKSKDLSLYFPKILKF